MKYTVAALSMFLSLGAHVSWACDRVAAGYETKDIMYVVCTDLSGLSGQEASDLIGKLFDQYKGPPDEVAIYFVASPTLVGKVNPSGNELVGFYYTHNNSLEIWPNSISNKKLVKVTWQ